MKLILLLLIHIAYTMLAPLSFDFAQDLTKMRQMRQYKKNSLTNLGFNVIT